MKNESTIFGKTGTLAQPISVACWNFGNKPLYTLHEGQRIEVCHVYDAESMTCRAINDVGKSTGIELEPNRLGYRFIIPNYLLRKACKELRPVPRKNFDLIGKIIEMES